MVDPLLHPDTGDDTGRGLDREAPPGTPRWVKAFGIAFLVLVLLIAVMVAGGHGPGRHMSGGGPDGHTPPFGVVEHGVRQP